MKKKPVLDAHFEAIYMLIQAAIQSGVDVHTCQYAYEALIAFGYKPPVPLAVLEKMR